MNERIKKAIREAQHKKVGYGSSSSQVIRRYVYKEDYELIIRIANERHLQAISPNHKLNFPYYLHKILETIQQEGGKLKMYAQLKQDRTDHFVMFCARDGCAKPMKITEVKTDKFHDTKVTFMHGKCECGNNAQKKIYWDCTCSSFCE